MPFKRNNHSGRKIAVGSVIAGVAGYLAGVLTAPKSGKQTREELADTAEGLKDSADVQLAILNTELKDKIKQARGKTMALSSSARAEFNETVVRAKDAQNKAAQVLKAFKNGEASDPDLNKAAKQARQALKNLGKYLKG